MKLVKLLLPAALLLLSIDGFAGQYKADPVYIDLEQQVATGSLYATRFSSNSDERIGCAVANGDERGLFGYCEAKYFDPDSAELLAADCFTYDDKMIEAIQSINTYSFVYFTWERQNRKGFDDNVCTNVTVATRSTHIPDAMATPAEVEVLGTTLVEVKGWDGIYHMNRVCRELYGDGARMCTTKQVIESPNWNVPNYLGVWVRPIVIETFHYGATGDPDDWAQVEYSGTVFRNFPDVGPQIGGAHVCGQGTPGNFGVILTRSETVSFRDCDTNLGVMCCR